MTLDYELARQETMKRNREMLEQLGLANHVLKSKPKVTRKKKPDQSKKRGIPIPDTNTSVTESEESERPQKLAKVVDEDGNAQGLRRSSRNKGKSLNYNDDGDTPLAASRALPRVVSARARAGMKGVPRDASIRKYDPKTYGSIPGVSVGSWWETREACSKDAIHAPWVAGIAPGPQGAYSIALSGGYEDDIDLGEAFTFTGCGGRDLKGTKQNPKNLRTAPQSCDQTFDNNCNAALLKSSQTKKPIRVIRGYKLDSPYGPVEGYRYDGLYTVEKAWMESGLNAHGWKVCKFAFKRMPGQPALPSNLDDDEEEEEPSTPSADDSEATE